MTSPHDDQVTAPVGTRGRIVTPTPPAPVPVPRAPQPAAAEPVEDRSSLRAPTAEPAGPAGEQAGNAATSDGDVVRATSTMAIATLLSRITGFLRTVMITSTLGGAIASAFQTANQLPNLITEIVLGAVLTSLVVPVLVRAEKEDPDRGEQFIRRLFTLAISLLATITVLAVICAPILTTMMLPEDGQVNTGQAVSFAYLLLPQISFYGLFALFQAILNTKGVFAPGAWAPVVNNLISIGVMALYWLLPGALQPEAASPVTDPHVLLLGLGTTLGVVVQCLILVPYLKRAGVNLRPLWGLDARLKQFGGMAVAIIAYVAISQAGYVVTSRVAASADASAPVVYQNAWLLLQVPYGVIGVTLLTAIMPRLSRNAADGDEEAVVRDLTLGSKLTFIALIPIVIFMTGFGIPIARGLFQYGLFDANQAELLGLTLSFSAFTLIPYALVLLHLRVFYAREEAWTPTFIIAGITGTKVVLTLLAPLVANSPESVVILLGTANGFGFISGAVIGAFLLRRKLGSLGGKAVMATTTWAVIASTVGLAVALAVNWVTNLILPEDIPSVLILVKLAVLGVIFLVVTGIVLSRSGLPEVASLGRALQRIPGMRRFIKVQDAPVEEPAEIAEIQPVFAEDSFMASPVPPPMSAGIVRGPSLVPGAPVSDGRFRLLQDCGSVEGARFWRAREQETGRTVALTFVDTSGRAPMAPLSRAEAAQGAAAVSRATRKLGELGLAAVAPNIEILSYRNGCLVVADWVEGTPLRTVAEGHGLDPRAVALATAPLAQSMATAHAAGLTLGLDNSSRVRISTDATAVLAFPAVLGEASVEKDLGSLNSTLNLLVGSTAETPEQLQAIADESDADAQTVAERLLAFAHDVELEAEAKDPEGYTEPEPELIEADEANEEDPEPAAGFGGREVSWTGFITIGALAMLFVVGMAALTVWLISLIGGESEAAPVDAKSIQAPIQGERETSTPARPPVLLDLGEATAYGAAADNEEATSGDVAAIADGDGNTSWVIKDTEAGFELAVAEPTQLNHVLVSHSRSTGAEYVIHGVNDEGEDKLASGELTRGRHAAELEISEEEYSSVIVEFTSLPSAGKITISEVEITGQP